MEVYILNTKYERIAYIDQAESILWNTKYNDVGECEIYIACDNQMLEYLQEGNYIYRSDDDMLCKIQTVEIETDVENGDYIIATGIDMVNIFSNRIIRWEVSFNGTVAEFIKKLVYDNVISPAQEYRKIGHVRFNDANFSELTETITINAFTDDLLETIKTICSTYNYGFKVSYLIDEQILEFKLYKGINKASSQNEEYVEFSPLYGNIISSNYKKDISNYKNICYVGYKNTSDVFDLLSVYNTPTQPTGEDRREIYIDGSNTSRDTTEEMLFQMFGNVNIDNNVYYNEDDIAVAKKDGDKIVVTDYTYLLLIRILGLNKLAEHNRTQAFTGNVDTINTYEYKTDYNLGDIVKVINDYGIEAEARIVEIMESDDNEDGYVVEPKFEYLN